MECDASVFIAFSATSGTFDKVMPTYLMEGNAVLFGVTIHNIGSKSFQNRNFCRTEQDESSKTVLSWQFIYLTDIMTIALFDYFLLSNELNRNDLISKGLHKAQGHTRHRIT